MLHVILIFNEVKVTETNQSGCEDLFAVKLFKFSHEERIMSKNVSVLIRKKSLMHNKLELSLSFF